MQYNKKQFNKVNDKKVMKKVKKQWVVVSLSTLATLGGVTYTMTFSQDAHAASKDAQAASQAASQDAHAASTGDTSVTNTNNISASYANQTVGSVAVTASTAGNQSLSSQAQSAYNTGLVDLSQTKYSSSGASIAANPASSLVSSSQASDVASAASDAVKYNSAINQAASDAFAGNGNNVATVASDAQNYYNAAYNGASNAKSLYNNYVVGYGTGTQDYTAFSQNTNTPGSSAATGTSSAQAATSAHSAALSYESSLNAKFNGKSNVTVHLGAAENGQITIPTADDPTITSQNGYTVGSELYNAYQFGVNYALAHQGTEDAKAGKWTGISKSQGLVYDASRQLSFPGDNYHPLIGSTNPYDQAYMGAQQAMNDQWGSNDTIQSYGYVLSNETANSNYSSGSQYYQMAYDNVAREMNDNNTAFVHNAWQFQRALAGNYHSDWSFSSFVNGTNSGYSAYNDAMGLRINDGGKGYSTVRLVNDIDFQGDPYVEHWPTIQHLINLTVDAQNHQVDFHGVLDQFVADAGVNPVLNIKNFQMAYSYNFYGFLKINQPGTVIYDNVNYMGAQMLSDWPAGGNDIRFKGNINEINVSTYQTSLNTGIHPTEGGGNQENMEVQNLLLYPGAKYFGSVAKDYGNNVIKLSGSLTMNEGSQMTLVPRGNGGYYARLGSNYGIVVTNGANLNINKGATLQIIPDSWNGSSTYANGIYTYGNINVNGGTLDIETAAPSYNSDATMFVDSTGQVNISNGGLVMVKSQGLGNSSTGTSYGLLYNNNGQVNVNNLGNLYISGDGTGQINLLAGPLNITNPGQNNITLDLTQNTNNSSRISNGKIDAYTSLVTYGVGVQGSNGLIAGQTNTGSSKILYSFHLYTQNGNYVNNYVDASGNKGSFPQSGNPNFVQIATVPAVYFVGPMTPVINSDGTYTLTGYAQVSDRKSTDTDPIYAQIGYGTQNSYPTLTKVSNGIFNSVTVDKNNYTQKISVPANYNYELIKYSIDMPKDYNPTKTPYVGLLLRYGVDGVDTVAQVQTKQFTSSQHSYDLSSDGKSLVDQSQQVIDTGSYTGISDGRDDALYYLSNGTQADQQRYTDKYKINDDYTNGYNSVMAGYNAFANGLPDPTSNPSAIPVGSVASNIANDSGTITDPQGYIDGYNRAKADAKGTLSGLNDFINGQPQSSKNSYVNPDPSSQSTSSPTAQYTNNYNNAYYNAIQGYQDRKNNFAPTNPNNVAYNEGFHAVDDYTSGIKDAANGTVSSDSQQNNAAYAIGVNAFNSAKKDVTTGSTTNTNGNLILTDAYNAAYTQIKSQYDNGAKAFLNSDKNDTSSLPSQYQDVSKQGYQDAIDGYNGTNDGHQGLSGYQLGQSVKAGEQDLVNGSAKNTTQASNADGYNKGYQDALNGYQDAINYAVSHGTNIDTNSLNGKTQAYKDAVIAAQNATQAIQDSKNDIDNNKTSNISSQSKAYQDAYNAYRDAYSAVAKTGQTNNANLNNQSDIYKTIYNAEYNDINSKYQNGLTDYIQNKGKNSDNDVYSTAYQDAGNAFSDFQNAYKDGNNPSSITPSNSNNRPQAYLKAFQYAKDAQTGAYDATNQYGNFNRPTQNDNPAYMDGFNAVRDAYANAALKTPVDRSNTSTAYQNVYKNALDKAQKDYNQAVNDFLDGKAAQSNDALGQQAQQDASLGYQAALSGKTEDQLNDTQKNNAGFMQAFTAAQDAQEGYKAAIAQKDNKGVNQDFENQQPKDEQGKIIDSAKYEAYLGAKEGLNGTSISDSDLSTHSIAYQQAYRQAYAISQSDAEQGVKDYLQGTKDDNKYKNDKNYQNGYDSAVNGYKRSSDSSDRLQELGYQGKLGAQSYLNGNPSRNSALSDGSSQLDAFSIGYVEAQNGSADAIKNLNDLTSSSKAPTDKSASYQLGYQNVIDQVLKGYNAAIANQNDSSYTKTTANSSNYDAYQAYTAAVAGLSAAKSGTEDPNIMNVTDPAQITPYIAVYKKAAKAYDAQMQSGLNDFINNGKPTSSSYVASQTNDAMKTAYTNAYNEALAGFKDHISDAQPGSSTNKNSQPKDASISAYNVGYDAYKYAKNGADDARAAKSTQVIKTDSTHSQLYVDGYNAEVQAIKDAQMGKDSSVTDLFSTKYDGTLSNNYNNQDQAYKSIYSSLLSDAADTYKRAVSDFLNTNGHDGSYTTDSSDYVYQLGFQDVKDGIKASSKDNNSIGYKAGYDYQVKITNGLGQVKSSLTATNSDPTTNDAIRGAAAGYTDSENGGIAKTNTNESLAYNVAYQKAVSDGQTQFVEGANDFLSGNAKQTGLVGYPGQDQSKGYDNARQGYFAASENQVPTEIQKNNPTYMMGYNAALVAIAANKGLSKDQALSQINKLSGDNTGYDKYFDEAKSGYTDGTSNVSVTNYKSPAYLTGYYAARGVKDFTSGNSQQNQTGITNLDDAAAAQNAYNYGYTQAQSGFNDATNTNGTVNQSGQSDAYIAGIKAYNDAISSNSSDVQAAIKLAKTTFTNNPALNVDSATQNSIRSSLKNAQSGYSNNNQAFSTVGQIAYLNTYIKASADYANGVNTFLRGNDNNASVPSDFSDIATLGFNAAKAAYNNALNNGNTNNLSTILKLPSLDNQTSNNTIGYTTGSNAASQIIQAFSDLRTKGTLIPQSSSDSNYQTAATAMLQAQNDLIAGLTEQDNSSKQSLVYANAYKLVYNYSQNEYQNGVDSVIKNTSLDNDTFAVQGASNAKSGFNDALAGLQPVNSNNNQYMQGYNAAQAIKNAYDDTMNNPNNSTNYSGSNATEQNDTKNAVAQALKDFQQNPNVAISNTNNSNGSTASTNTNGNNTNTGTTSDAAKINGTGISNIVYNTAWNAIQGAAMNGMNNYLFNQHMLNNLTSDQAQIIGKTTNPNNANTFTEAESQGFVQGYKAAQSGFEDALSGNKTLPTDATSLSKLSNFYINGFTEGSQISGAVKAATVDGPQGINNPKVIEQAYQEAYQAALDAQNNLKNGNNESINDTSTHDIIYMKAYNQALTNNQAAYTNGALTFAQNISLSSLVGNNGVRSDQLDITSNGYNKALEGYNFFKSGNTEESESAGQKTNIAFQIGVNLWKSVQTGYQAAMKNANDSDESNKSSFKDQSDMNRYVNTVAEGQAYNAAVKAMNDYFTNGVANAPQSSNPFYKDAYNQAAAEVSSKVSQGSQSFLSGNDSTDPNAASTGTDTRGLDQKALSKGFTDTQSGFNEAGNSTLTTQQLSSKSAAYQAGYQARKSALAGYNKTQPQPTDPTQLAIYQDAQTAADKAHSDIAANTVSTDSDRSGKDRVYNLIYDQIVNDYKVGMQQFKDGQTTANGNSDVQAGFKDEQNGYSAGLTTKNLSVSPSLGYNDGFQLGNASTDATNLAQSRDQNAPYQSSDNQLGKDAYNGAQAGFNAAYNNTGSSAAPATKPSDYSDSAYKAYQDAYEKAYQEAINLIPTGAQAFLKHNQDDDLGLPSNYYTDNGLYKASIKKGYDDAKSGYEDGLQGKSTAANATQEYTQGYQQGLAVKNEMSYLRSNANATSDSNAQNDNDRDAFNGALAGFTDGQVDSNHAVDTSQSGTYQKAYLLARNEAASQYANGMNQFVAGQNNTNGPDNNNFDSIAYNRGFNETSQGYTDGLNQPNQPKSQSTGYKKGNELGSAVGEGYASAKAGNDTYTGPNAGSGEFTAQTAFDAAKSGFTDAKNRRQAADNSGQNVGYQNAYKLAFDQYTAGLQKGANDFAAGNVDVPTDSKDLLDQSVPAGYELAKSGYDAGFNGQDATDSSDSIYMNGYNLGKGAGHFVLDKSGYDSTNSDQLNGYNQALAGFNYAADHDSSDSQLSDQQKHQSAFMDGFKVYVAYQKGLQDGSQPNATNKDANNQDYGLAYDAAQSARQNFMHPDRVNNDDKAPIYQAIYHRQTDAFMKQYQSGVNDYLQGGQGQGTDFHSQGYTDATNGFNDGFSDNGQNQNPYNVGYSESYNAGQQAYQAYKQAEQDSSQRPADSASLSSKQAYQATVDAMNAARYANPSTIAPSSASPAYQKTYALAVQDAITAVNNGLNALTNAEQVPTDTGTSLDKLTYHAYSDAKNGFAVGLINGNFDQSQKNNIAYVHGYNLGQGASQFLNGTPKSDSQLGNDEVSQGYKDARDGYNAAKAGTVQNQLTAVQKNDPVFMAGYNAWVAATNAANATYTETTPEVNVTGGQDGHDAVIQAVTDARNGKKQDISSHTQAYQDQYNAYFDKVYGNYDPKADISKSEDADKFTGDYFNAIKQYLADNTASLPHNMATDAGLADAQKGFINGLTNSPESLPYAGYQPAYDQGNKLSIGFKAALNDVVNGNPHNQDQNVNDAYLGAVAGYQAAQVPGASPVDNDSTHSLPYRASYQAAYDLSLAQINKGTNDFISGVGKSAPADSNAMVQSSYNFGFNHAQNGYTNAISDTPNANAENNTPFTSGYQAANDAIQGRNDANKAAPDANQSATNTGTAGYQVGYNATVAARSDARQNHASDVSNQPLIYQDVYNHEYTKDNAAYMQGYNDFVNNTAETKDGQFRQLGYDDTSAGYSDKLKGITSNNNSYGYQQGVQMAANFQAAYQAAVKNPNPDDKDRFQTNDPQAQQSYNAALAGFKAATSEQPMDSNLANNSSEYQRAYKTAYNEAKAQVAAGSQQFLNGLANNSSKGTDADSVAFTTGYNNTSNGFNDGFNGNSQQLPNSATYMTGYNIGKGAADFVNNGVSQSSDRNYQYGFDRAQAGFNNRASGTTKAQLTQAQLNDPVYMSGFNIADEIQQGINDAVNNPTQANAYNSDSPHDRAYRAAVDALNNFKAVNIKDVSQLPIAYRTAYQQVLAQIQQNAVSGSNDYLSGKDNSRAQSQNIYDQAYTIGFNQSQTGFKAVIDQHVSANSLTTTQRNDPSFMAGFNNATGANDFVSNQYGQSNNGDYTNGYQDASNGFDTGMTGITMDKLTPAQQKDAAFMMGFHKAADSLKGYQLAQQSFDNDDNDSAHQSQNDEDVTYRAAKAGFKAAQNGLSLTGYQNVSVIYDKAYKRAYAEWQSWSQAGASQAINSQKAVTDKLNPVDKAAYNAGFVTGPVALKDAIAIQTKQPANKLVGANGLDRLIYDAILSGYQNGYQAGLTNQPNNANSNDGAYQVAYAKGYSDGYSNSPAASNNNTNNQVVIDFSNGVRNTPNTSPQATEQYVANYNQISQGFKLGVSNKNINTIALSSYYVAQGYQLAQDVKRAIKDAKATKSTHPLSANNANRDNAAYVTGYNAYKAGVKAEKANIHRGKAKAIDYKKMGELYGYAFKQGYADERKRQSLDGSKAGRIRGNNHMSIPKMDKNNVDYVRSYEKAYKQALQRRLPRYIYNVKAVYTHKQTRFTKGNRVVYYAKKPRYAAHVFKVEGIAYYKNGIPRYRVAGGGILTASADATRSAYYSVHNDGIKYKVIRPTGIWLHDDKKFNVENRLKHYAKDRIIKIRKVVKYHGITRLYVNENQYITSNKTYVKIAKH
ncbi:DUF5776 domain-containing protein [Apilactobacillus apinorum]|uniref:DUF5776 domain-containing protein n=1 Tax=Apilactobacillus apinorum TaxID=1218495 RepID=A0ABP9ZI11_9LACO